MQKAYSPECTIFVYPDETGKCRMIAVDFIDDRTNHPEDTVFTFPGKRNLIRVVGVATRIDRETALSIAAGYASGIIPSKRIEFNSGQPYDVTRKLGKGWQKNV